MPQQNKVRIGDWTLDPNLNRIERDDRFVKLEPLTAKVLEFLAQNANQVVSVDELTEQLWQRRFVDDSPVYRTVAELRRALEDDAQKPRYIETIRKRGYRLVAPVEWLAESGKGESAASPGSKRKSNASKIALFALLGALVVAALYQTRQNDPVPGTASVAVLPFEDMSADKSKEHFADGITEVLIHQLSQVANLHVIARTSSFAFKGSNADVREIGQTLNVEAVLEGSVQLSDGKLRIAAQLIDTRTGTHYWSKLYDRGDDDIFAIQDEIAASVVAALERTLLNDQHFPTTNRIGTKNIDAYDEYLKGLQQLAIASRESLPRAVTHFRQAVQLDDDYNEARLALAETYNAMLRTFQISYAELINWNELIPREVLQRDPDSAQAMSYLARADFSRNFPTGSGEAERLYARAIEIAPRDPGILWSYAYYLGWNDRPDEAIERLEQALETDPLSAAVLFEAASHGNLHYAERLRSVHPENPAGWSVAAEIYLARGELAEAYRYLQVSEQKDPLNSEFPAYSAMVLMTVGLLDEAGEALQRAELKGPGAPLTVAASIALMYRRGMIEQAGESSLNAMLAGSPPRRFGPLVLSSVALEYTLRINQVERFVAALKALHEAPGFGGMNLSDPTVNTMLAYTAKLTSVPAFRAVGEQAFADRVLASVSAYYEQASDTFKYHETEFEVNLLSGDYEAALDILDELVESGRAGAKPSNFSSLSVFRWWLQFDGVRVEALSDNPRYKAILDRHAAKLAKEREAILALMQ